MRPFIARDVSVEKVRTAYGERLSVSAENDRSMTAFMLSREAAGRFSEALARALRGWDITPSELPEPPPIWLPEEK